MADRDPYDRDAVDRTTTTTTNPTTPAYRRGRGSSMAWILGALAIAIGLIAFFMYGWDDDVDVTGSVPPPAATAPASPGTPAPAAPATPAPANPQ